MRLLDCTVPAKPACQDRSNLRKVANEFTKITVMLIYIALPEFRNNSSYIFQISISIYLRKQLHQGNRQLFRRFRGYPASISATEMLARIAVLVQDSNLAR